MVSLSEHFRERWVERVKSPVPSVKAVEKMLKGSIVLQKFRKTYTPRGRLQTVLALHWVPEAGLVIKMDTPQMQAVTVITEGLGDTEKEEADA